MLRNLGILVASLAFALFCTGLATAADPQPATKPAAAAKPAEAEETFAMREVSVFEFKVAVSPNTAYTLLRGQSVECSSAPDKQVKTYPKLKSKHPFYGKVKFDRNLADPKAGTEYHFVLDESGEKPAEAKPGDAKPADSKPSAAKAAESNSLLAKLASSLLGKTTSPSPPEARTEPVKLPITYDRLYFDVNHDLDLTNDPVLKPMKEPPAEANPFGSPSLEQMVVFDDLVVPFDYGPGVGVRPFRLMPRFTIARYQEKQYVHLYFVSTAVRQGQIRIGAQRYSAVLAQPYLISGRFDRPWTGLLLTSPGSSERDDYWWGAEQLSAVRRAEGKYYTVSSSPTGDQLTVKPYRGELGIFKVGPGKRDFKNYSMSGSLRSETAAVAIGDTATRGRADAKPTTEWSVPVGDYLPAYLTIEYGRLRISLSDNYHSDGRPRDMERQRAYTIPIRKDKPFVLDFSNKPEIMFASPAKEQTLKLGEELRVAAVLTDPKLGIMIRGLNDSGRSQKEVYKTSDGKERSFDRPLSLDPKVTITNASGKQVAEGKMPFG